jgi:hypothetical protein
MQIDQPIILATSQNVTCTGFSMLKLGALWTADITFSISDENGHFVKTDSVNISADKWNDFWSNFTSGAFLYQTLITDQGITATAPATDSDFVN